jgi:hypothetical protein
MDSASQKLALERVIQEFLLRPGPSEHTFDLPDNVVAAMVELESLRDDSSNSDEPTAPARGPLKPRPHSGSGALAFPEPY